MNLRKRKESSTHVLDQVEQSEASCSTPTSPTSKRREKCIRNAEAQKNRLKMLKSSPTKYKQFRERETLRIVNYRMHRSEEQKAKDRENARIRMQRMRQRRKDDGLAPTTSSKKKTRSSITQQQEKWRDYQRQYRSSLSSQRKRRINEQRREQRALKRQQTTPSAEPAASKTNAAQRKALSRSWTVAPKCPDQFAEVLNGMIRKSTPRKRAALRGKGILSPISRKRIEFLESTSLKVVLDDIRKSRKNRDVQLRRLLYRSVCIKRKIKKTTARCQLGLSWAFLSSPARTQAIDYRKKRIDTVSPDTLAKVLDFYARTAREMPMARLALGGQSVKVMDCTMKTAYSEFKSEFPNIALSFSKFTVLRPKHVKPVANTKLMQCLCEYCINVDFKIQSLHMKCIQAGKQSVIHHKYQASSLTLCPTEDLFPRKKCIDRECADCGVQKLHQQLQPLLDECGEMDVKWKRWQNEAYMKTTKSGIESEAKHFVLKEKSGPVRELVDDLLVELQPFSKHLVNAKWQGRQFESLKANIPEGWLLTCLDFAQNYNCHFQDEIQSAHWSYKQATIHPVVSYYRCPECGEPMHESCIAISDDMKHDYHAVHHFTKLTNDYLVNKGLTFKQQVQFSDGSPTQYKSKIPFSDASHGFKDFGWQVQKHFFGTRHGKGPCDAEIGVIKKCALTAIRSRRVVIRNAWELYQFCRENLSEPKTENHVHMRRSFFFVHSSDIDRDRGERTQHLKAVPNTRASHSFIGVEPFLVSTKERSCFCESCISDTRQPELCRNADFTGNTRLISLKCGKSTLDQSTSQVQSAEVLRAKVPSSGNQVPPVRDSSSSLGCKKWTLSSSTPILPVPVLSTQDPPAQDPPAHALLAQNPPVQVHPAHDPPTQVLDEADTSCTNNQTASIPPISGEKQTLVQSGDYVAVKFEGSKKASVVYMATVLEKAQDGLLKLQFMKQSGSYFIFTDEVFYHPLDDVVTTVLPPDLAPRSMTHYVFAEDDLVRVRAAFVGKCMLR